MGINDELRSIQEHRRAEDDLLRRTQEEARKLAPVLRAEFDEFREALIAHEVRPHIFVRMTPHFEPQRVEKRLFSSPRTIPASRSFEAEAVGQCYVFHSLLIFEDGRIAKFPDGVYWGVGKLEKWHPQGNSGHFENLLAVRSEVHAAAGPALSAAGLGDQVSGDHLYIHPDFSVEDLDWDRDLSGLRTWNDLLGLMLDETCFRKSLDGKLELVWWDGWETEESVPLHRAFANYIQAGGRNIPATTRGRSGRPSGWRV